MRTRQAKTSPVGASDAKHDSFGRVSVWVSPRWTTCAPALDKDNFGEGPDTSYRDHDEPNDRLTNELQDLGHLRS